tara:strand:+ start:453 stop:1709 length:1257 start_codon:yes stop_codon:yes gene_type:complete
MILNNFKNNYFLYLTVIAFWIKFNIVFFTNVPYTATKYFYPFYFVILIIKLKEIVEVDKRLFNLILFIFLAFIPIGYLNHSYDLVIYKQWSLSLLSYLTLYIAATYLVSENKRHLITICCYIFSFLGAIYCLIQFNLNWTYEQGHFREPFNFARPFGILDDPDHSSSIYIIGLFLTIFYSIRKKHFYFLTLFCVVFIYAIVVSTSAGAFLSIIGALIIFFTLLFFVNLKISKLRIFLIFTLTWLCIFPAMFLFIHIYNYNILNIKEIISLFKSTSTVITRFDLINLSFQIISENPFFGTGLANDMNPEIFKQYYNSSMSIKHHFHIHNTYLSAASTIGLIPTISLLSLIMLSIYKFSELFFNYKSIINRILILIIFTSFMTIQIQSYSLLMLYSISFWFSLIIPFTINDNILIVEKNL